MIRRTNKNVNYNGDIVTWYDRVSQDFSNDAKPVKETLITKYFYSDSSESKSRTFLKNISI